MKYLLKHRAVACCAVGLVLALARNSAQAESLDFTTSGESVHVTAISPSVFRISIGHAGRSANPLSSIFLDPMLRPGDVGHRGGDGNVVKLSTSAATLEVDQASGAISLRDANGSVLIPPAPIAAGEGNGGKAGLEVHLGWPADRPFDVYGCGNSAASLVQHKVPSKVGNRVAVQPFFWSPAGFATFVVGDDDNAPAQCDGKVQQGAITWRVPGARADVYLIAAPKMADATGALSELTGRPPVPPRWTFGYLQSRWGWADKAYIDDTLHQFQARKLPVDAFIFDFEWYTATPDYSVPPQGVAGFSDFGVNPKLFPNFAEQVQALHDAGVHFVGIRKPRLGNADTLAMARSRGWGFGGAASGTDARALLFGNVDVRTWYAKQLEPLLRDGVDGWWNDEGEFTYSNYTYWNEAELTALDAVRPNGRMWSINRAFAPGTARLGAAAWTGDIRGSWQDFQNTPTTLLNWSLAGMPFCGCDIGGYRGNAPAELVVRWMEAGTFFPIMRAHSRRTDKPHFPWLYGDEAESAIRKALDLRYQLVPVLYSLAHQTNETGEPVMRPLVMQYPHDSRVADLSSEWLIGNDLLAAPVLEEGGHRSTYLPDDIWYDFGTGQRVTGGRDFDQTLPLDASPLYVRGGTILTLAPVIQHTSELPGGPLDVQIYPGRDGRFTLVEDDGDTRAYAEGKIRKTTFVWDDTGKTLSWSCAGPYDGADCFRTMRVSIHDGADQPPVQQALSASGQLKLQ